MRKRLDCQGTLQCIMGANKGGIAVNIKEIEQKTGMTRANIRYYEAEGLIHPQRRENGYREYTAENVDALLKIKLLRSMDISLEDIRRLQAGETTLQETAQTQIAILSEKRDTLVRTLAAVQLLAQRGDSFETLDALFFLGLLENGSDALKRDTMPRLCMPWRRYFARMVDLELYALMVGFLIRDFLLRNVLLTLFTFAAMLLTEPLLLYLFGTTPGKAIFGIRVTDGEEGRLAYARGLERTWMVLLEGMALNIPFLGWYFQYRCLQAAENGDALSWEQDSELTYKDAQPWRNGLCAVVYCGLLVCRFLLMGGL